ncbi:MAG TPA: FIST N-terminal domain-containing protein [Polyangiaceae bacterium]|nr:FIST N-terminal domain-containing protein [Polyangiaceae bacterium]
MAKVTLTTARTAEGEAAAAADELVGALGGARPELAMLFIGSRRDQGAIYRAVRERLPRATKVVAASSDTAIDNAGFHENGVVLAALSGDLEVGVGLGRGLASDASGAGIAAVNQALAELGARPSDVDPRTYVAMVIDDGYRLKKEELLLGILTEAPALSLVGGGAGSHLPLGDPGVAGVVQAGGETLGDAALVVVVRTRAPWAVLRHHAYRPLGERLTITKVDPSCKLALEIDGQPAARAYAERLGVGVDELAFGLPRGFSDRPTAVRVGREYFMHAAIKPLPDDSILFCNLLREGTELELMQLVDMGEALAAFLRDELPSRVPSPQATLLFSCNARSWVARRQGMQAGLDRALSLAPPSAGMNAMFELYNGFQINSTITVLAFGARDE